MKIKRLKELIKKLKKEFEQVRKAEDVYTEIEANKRILVTEDDRFLIVLNDNFLYLSVKEHEDVSEWWMDDLKRIYEIVEDFNVWSVVEAHQ